MTCQNKTSWLGFGSIPTSGAIFVKIGVGRVTWGLFMVHSLMFPLLSMTDSHQHGRFREGLALDTAKWKNKPPSQASPSSTAQARKFLHLMRSVEPDFILVFCGSEMSSLVQEFWWPSQSVDPTRRQCYFFRHLADFTLSLRLTHPCSQGKRWMANRTLLVSSSKRQHFWKPPGAW